jgi:ATP-dependent Clp protease protease subunit
MTANEMRERFKSKRKLVVPEEITDQVVDRLASDLIELNLISEEKIELFIDSNGGKTFAALKMYDVMKSLKAPVTGVVIGGCHSAALVVYLACQKRVATKHSRFVIHETSIDIKVRVNDDMAERFEVLIKGGQVLARKYKDILVVETKQTLETINRLEDLGERLKRGLFAEEAKDYGFVHEIVDSYPLL